VHAVDFEQVIAHWLSGLDARSCSWGEQGMSLRTAFFR
jgi:hypothetical protein